MHAEHGTALLKCVRCKSAHSVCVDGGGARTISTVLFVQTAFCIIVFLYPTGLRCFCSARPHVNAECGTPTENGDFCEKEDVICYTGHLEIDGVSFAIAGCLDPSLNSRWEALCSGRENTDTQVYHCCETPFCNEQFFDLSFEAALTATTPSSVTTAPSPTTTSPATTGDINSTDDVDYNGEGRAC